jgi:exopolysaccharide production protein ExoZ
MLPGIFPIAPMMAVAWSLSYELCFYLTMPLLFLGLRLQSWPRTARIALFFGLSAGWLVLFGTGWTGHPRLIMFGCGILLRELVHLRFKWSGPGNFAAALLFAAAIAVSATAGRPIVTRCCGSIITSSVTNLGVLFAGTLILGYFAFGTTGWLSRFLSWDWLRWFGNMSYSYYLIHGLILHLVKTVADYLAFPRMGPVGFVAFCSICFVGAAAGSAMLFLAVEKRFSLTRRAMTPSRHEVPPPWHSPEEVLRRLV